MQSRTSFFNSAIFRSNLGRFSPLWGLYTIFVLVMMVLGIGDQTTPYYSAHNMAELAKVMPIVSAGYAFLCAQVLFGDLYNTRLCYAMQAMPMTRTCKFLTNYVTGLLFFLIPNIPGSILAAAWIRQAAPAAFWWYLAGMLQYVFFFGLAVLCMLLCGNRLGSTLLYGVVNTFTLFLLVVDEMMYTPAMYGIVSPNNQLYMTLSPAAGMTVRDYITLQFIPSETATVLTGIEPGPGWCYLTVCMLLGIAMAVLALVLYRRRKLERAGDFLAFPKLQMAFLMVFTVLGGCLMQILGDTFYTYSTIAHILFFLLGMGIAYYVGLMMLRRQVAVFRRKALAPIAILFVLFLGSMALTIYDAFGTVHYIPGTDDVLSVSVNCWGNRPAEDDGYVLTEPADIDIVRAMHQEAIRSRDDAFQSGGLRSWLYDGNWVPDSYDQTSVEVRYTLRSGKEVQRNYLVNGHEPAGEILQTLMNRPEYLLGISEAEIPAFCESITFTDIWSTSHQEGSATLTDTPVELLQAIVDDCKAGTISRARQFRNTSWEDWNGTRKDDTSYVGNIEFNYRDSKTDHWIYLTVYTDCENTVRWMIQNGYYDPNAVPEFPEAFEKA